MFEWNRNWTILYEITEWIKKLNSDWLLNGRVRNCKVNEIGRTNLDGLRNRNKRVHRVKELLKETKTRWKELKLMN